MEPTLHDKYLLPIAPGWLLPPNLGQEATALSWPCAQTTDLHGSPSRPVALTL
jgi:hypothetical protein